MTTVGDDRRPGGARATTWFTELLRLDRTGDRFRAPERATGGDRLFGGSIAAQALAAAGATVPHDKQPQSLHAYFVRPGRPDAEVELEVERTRDGRSFDTRRVTALQRGEAILEMLASFHRPEVGVDWQAGPAGPLDLAGTIPLELPPEMANGFEFRATRPHPSGWVPFPYWVRMREPVGPEPLVRACALTFMSDMGIMAAACRIPGTEWPAQTASLDHALWLHRPFEPDRWHQYHAAPVNGSDNRGLAIGTFHDLDGRLVATVAQEALARP